jgi:hypothetical protein
LDNKVKFQIQAPIKNLHHFYGRIQLPSGMGSNESHVDLDIGQFLHRGSTL